MKKPRITTALLLLALLVGCSQPEDEVDIPSLGDTTEQSDETTAPEKIRPENFDRETYEGLRNTIIDTFHLMLEDLDILEEKGRKTEVFDPLREIAQRLTDGIERVSKFNATMIEYPSRKTLMDYCSYNIEALFTKYPDKIEENPDLVEYLKVITRHQQLHGLARDSLKNDVKYNLLFPNASEAVLTENADGVSEVSIPGHDGDIVIYYGETDYPMYDEKSGYILCAQPAVLRANYSGVITVMPLGKYNAVGRPTYLTVEGVSFGEMITVIGDFTRVGMSNDGTSALDAVDMPDISHVEQLLRDNPSPKMIQISRCGLTSVTPVFDIINEEYADSISFYNNNLTGTVDLSSCKCAGSLYINKNPGVDKLILPEYSGRSMSMSISNTSIGSLDFLEGYKYMISLDISDTKITDLTPLIGISINSLTISPDTLELEAISELNVSILSIRGYHADWNDKILPLAKANGTTIMVTYYDKEVQIQAKN